MALAKSGSARAAAARPEAPRATDAWIFASLAGGGTGRATTLAQLVAAADVLNRALPTPDEVRSALGRLAARGLVARRGRSITLTALGRQVQSDGRARRGGLFSIVDNMRRAIRSPRHRAPPLAAPPAFPFVTDAAMARACAAYRSMNLRSISP
jgi:hypothetical protein